jgi:starch synthase
MSNFFPAALLLPQDTFDTNQKQVMGRRVAGRGFAEAITSSLHSGEQLKVIGFNKSDLQSLSLLLQPRLAPNCKLLLQAGLTPETLREVGSLHVPDPGLARWSLLRSQLPPHAFSLTGIIHTVCSDVVVNALDQLYHAPLHPWDALVCTSRAGQQVVKEAVEGFRENLSKRLGIALPPAPGPKLPIIPLAIDPAPFQKTETRENLCAEARQSMGIEPNAFVVLFVGRLSFHSKAHPAVLYQALSRLAKTNRDVVLIECGHLFNEPIGKAFDQLAGHFPKLKIRRVGGLHPATEFEKQQCLFAADVFCSPADNLQETFGLSLLEAMAAELPIIASDWNGYRDIVEHGITGELIETRGCFAQKDKIDSLELGYRLGNINYDTMIGMRSLSVELDGDALFDSFRRLSNDKAMCRSMGLAGKQRLTQLFTWQVVAKQYRELWLELAEIRNQAKRQNPNANPEAGVTSYGRLFGHYPTKTIHSGLEKDLKLTTTPSSLPPRLLKESMNHDFFVRLLGEHLETVISHIETHGFIDHSILTSIGIPDSQKDFVLIALRKLGILTMVGS